MFARWSVKGSVAARLLAMTLVAVGVPVIVMAGLTFVRGAQLDGALGHELRRQTEANLGAVSKGVYAILRTQSESLDQALTASLNVLRDTAARHGGLGLLGTTVQWTAANQFSGEKTTIELPGLGLGKTWLGQNTDPKAPTLLVDEATRLAGGTATVFQRMDAKGNMLRVATNVISKAGTRAIGTYIPAVNPDGAPNPVVASVIAGKTYRGRAFVVDAWYQTVYEPIRGPGGDVIGMLYAGIRQESVPSLRQSLLSTRVGVSGHVVVLGGKGDHRGRYILSKDDARTGQSAWDDRAADGRPIYQEVIGQAVKASAGEIAIHRFAQADAPGGAPVAKVMAVTYFEPWDWVVGVVAAEDEFAAPQRRVSAAIDGLVLSVIAVGGLIAAALVVIARRISRGVTRPLARTVEALEAAASGDLTARVPAEGRDEIGRMGEALNGMLARFHDTMLQVQTACRQTTAASQQLSAAAGQLSSGAQQQASSLEETAASLEEITGTVKQNADNAHQANQLSLGSRATAERGGTVVRTAVTAMEEINRSSQRIADITTAIDEIAFQTNLLALNAAVEAARAGEQGRGFAVVAAEVRNLAQRSATAAKEIKGLIEDSVCKVQGGAELVTRSGETLEEIVTSVKRVSDLVAEIAAASTEQSTGVDQVNRAVTQMDQVVQANAAQTEQLAGTAQTLAEQAAGLERLVARFRLSAGAAPSSVTSPPVAASAPAGALVATRPAARPGAARPARRPEVAAARASHAPDASSTRGSASAAGDGFEEF